MRDSLELIGKQIKLKDKIYTINNINFMPHPTQPLNHIWIGLENDKNIVNYSYEDLLPYFKDQFKL
jgi:hypothetical protein